MKTPENLLKASKFIKKRHQHKCFPVKFANLQLCKIFKETNFEEHLRRTDSDVSVK